ncbi:hypothetical protein BDR26DRAFT_870725 [Obelidium mucronatum]|nr:hypothetical protein BDR26DRAFT_870725 [Obelidium mucronatum]
MAVIVASAYATYFPWVMTIASSTLLVSTLVFVTCIETTKSKLSWYRNINTPFNRAILAGISATTALNLTNGILYNDLSNDGLSTIWLLYSLRVTFLAIGEMSYFSYTMKRGIPIVEQLNLTSYGVMKWLLLVAPASYVLQALPNILTFTLIQIGVQQGQLYSVLSICSYLFVGLGGFFLVVSEAYLLYAFVRFMLTTRYDDTVEIDARFRIISQYGICTAFVGLVAFVVYLIGCFAVDSEFYVAASHGIFVFLFSILFFMKVALYLNDVKRISDSQKRLDVAAAGGGNGTTK